jgi:hypothetical protein
MKLFMPKSRISKEARVDFFFVNEVIFFKYKENFKICVYSGINLHSGSFYRDVVCVHTLIARGE